MTVVKLSEYKRGEMGGGRGIYPSHGHLVKFVDREISPIDLCNADSILLRLYRREVDKMIDDRIVTITILEER